MASRAVAFSTAPHSDFQPVIEADQSHLFGKIYVAIRNYMATHPAVGFQEMETLLNAHRCTSRLLAYPTSKDAKERAEWPPGTPRDYQLFISVANNTRQMNVWMKQFGSVKYQDNFAKLSECGFSSFWLRNHTRLMKLIGISPSVQLERFVQGLRSNTPRELKPAQEEMKNDMRFCQRAIGMVVEQYLLTYCPAPKRVFEIGSGYAPILPHLPPSFSGRVHLSDINAGSIEYLRENCKGARVSHYDALEPAGQEGQTYDCVVMNDVLNVFSSTDIAEALKGAWNVLKPGGFLINFTVRNSAFSHCLDEFRNEGFIYCPKIDEKGVWRGIHFAEIIDFQKRIAAMPLEQSQLQKVLKDYASSDIDVQREITLRCVEHMGNDLSEFQLLADAFMQLGCQSIDFEEHHAQTVQWGVQNAGFELKACQKEETLFVGPKTVDQRLLSPENNYFSANGLDSTTAHLPHLHPADVKEEASVHVIVAQKYTAIAGKV